MTHAHVEIRQDATAAGAVRTTTGRHTAPSNPGAVVELIETNVFSGPITVPKQTTIGDTALRVHPLALGASTFGWTLGPDEAHDVLDRHAAVGGDFIDTADSYAAGRSELIVGGWLASRRVRDRMTIATKIGRHPDYPGLRPASILGAVDASLARLRTDRIDLLYLHGEDPDVPLEETLGTIGSLMEAGKVLAVGASDFSPERLVEARVLAANGLPRISAITTRYNLMERRAYEGALELVAHAQGLSVVPYFGLANGFLGGHIRKRSEVRHDARGARLAKHLGRRGNRVLAALDEIAFAYGAEPATVALAWLLAKPNVVAPAVSAATPEQVDALVAAALLPLSRSDLVELDRASA